ncbi:MAG: hypothetical protein V3T83_18610 [Acidobacteriota bacterium]
MPAQRLGQLLDVRRPGRLLLRARLRFEIFEIELPGGHRVPVSIRSPKLKGGSTVGRNLAMALRRPEKSSEGYLASLTLSTLSTFSTPFSTPSQDGNFPNP